MDLREKAELVKKQVLIPKYFAEIIVPDMPDYYNDYPADFVGRPVVKCPIHSENTPSLRYYEETNTYNCFGCTTGGDVIRLHQDYMMVNKDIKVSFREAVEFLYAKFIVGSKVEVATSVEREKERLNSNIEIMRFRVFRDDIERMLILDSKMSVKRKAEVYNMVDTVNTLISMDAIRAEDGIAEIRKTLANN